jgi:hypothetical protein
MFVSSDEWFKSLRWYDIVECRQLLAMLTLSLWTRSNVPHHDIMTTLFCHHSGVRWPMASWHFGHMFFKSLALVPIYSPSLRISMIELLYFILHIEKINGCLLKCSLVKELSWHHPSFNDELCLVSTWFIGISVLELLYFILSIKKISGWPLLDRSLREYLTQSTNDRHEKLNVWEELMTK